MAKETFERSKPHVNVGTIGHIDHGKTTTHRCHAWPCRLKRAWRTSSRMPISPRAVPSATRPRPSRSPWRTSSMKPRTDTMPTSTVPGHADFIKNMITGAAQMDGAILVVSAADGPMPQTREHICWPVRWACRESSSSSTNATWSTTKSCWSLVELEDP